MALITAFRSPRTPAPLSRKTSATRKTYPRLGSDVTRRWMSCLQMNGPTLGWLKMLSRATLSSALELAVVWLALAGIVVPRRRTLALFEWFDAVTTMGLMY